MRKIAVVTGTRAEYGVLKNTLKCIEADKDLELQLIVTGTHLSHEYGYTIKEIEEDGFEIKDRLSILMSENNGEAIAKTMGLLMLNLSQVFERLAPDILLVVGDRYEMLAVVSTAAVMKIPTAHISGGEITEGAMDDQIRHAITKMVHIHFPGAKAYADNIIKMGEEAWRVFNVGDPGVENIKNIDYIDKENLKIELGVEVDEDTLLVTYHPVTLEIDHLQYQVENLINALSKVNKKLIITYPNSDNGGKYIINELVKFSKDNNNVYLYENLGIRKYLSVMKLCGAVVGNSSSSIVEAPVLKVPVVNIGNRQKGRLMAENIIQCGYSVDDIESSILKALSKEFKDQVKSVESLYGEGNTSKEITSILKSVDIDEKLLKKKLVWS
jgi:UDP-hydrolysing UDP-N-acetyl-D-glucosamine 2-epimerase